MYDRNGSKPGVGKRLVATVQLRATMVGRCPLGGGLALICLMLAAGPVHSSVLGADEFELPPINYSKAAPDNRVSRFQSRLDRGDARLEFEEGFGYLRDLLRALDIPSDSQTLVFSKTSMQRGRIAPRTPRALYFNDDIYVGFCHQGEMLEVSVADPRLGAVFYTLEQAHSAAPRLIRQTDNCLTCHGSGRSEGIPSLRLRSLFVDVQGFPILSQGSHEVDDTTAFQDRWGGWYVTGVHGAQSHLGNLIVSDPRKPPPYDNAAGQNVVDLSDRFPVSNYLTPHSDIVALMVLEHQVRVHNLITQANFTARQALHYEANLNRALGEPEGNRLESTTRRIHSAGDRLLAGLLFVGEAPIGAPITGSTGFSKSFSQAGPRDHRGRSLRDFDLKTRMFEYPCSYLIYSSAFDRLPEIMRAYVVGRLHDVLTGKDHDEAFAHLSSADRQAILEIIGETKPGVWDSKARPSDPDS